MTDGMRSSEFYIALAVTVVGAVAATFSEQPWAQAAGAVAAALASAGYSLSRAKAKEGQARLQETLVEEKGWVQRDKNADRLRTLAGLVGTPKALTGDMDEVFEDAVQRVKVAAKESE